MTCFRNNVLRYALLLLRFGLGVVFIYAAWTKLREPWMLFAMAVDAYGVLPSWAVIAVARVVPWAELVLGILLIAGLWRRITATAASAILLVFFTLLVRSYIQGLQINCGCFGLGEPLSPRTLVRDGALLACSLALAAGAFVDFAGRRSTNS